MVAGEDFYVIVKKKAEMKIVKIVTTEVLVVMVNCIVIITAVGRGVVMENPAMMSLNFVVISTVT